jgi:hypothetical protein
MRNGSQNNSYRMSTQMKNCNSKTACCPEGDMETNRTWEDGVPLLQKILRNLVYTPCKQASKQVCFWNTHCTQHLYRGKKQTVSSVEGINPCSYHPSCAWEQNQKLIYKDWSVEAINPCSYHPSCAWEQNQKLIHNDWSVEAINPCSYHPSCAWEQNQKLIHNDCWGH